MKDLYIKRWEEYTPLLFLLKEYKKKKLIKVDNDTTSEYNSLVNQFKMDYVFDLNKIIRNAGFNKETILGKGLIIRKNQLVGIVVYKKTAPKNLSIPELRKNTFILLNKIYFNYNLQELARLKKSMNTYGLSSRTQIIFIDDFLEDKFSQHPLKNTLADYDNEIQKNLSSKFLKSLNIPEVIEEEVIEEEIQEVNSLNSYQGYSVGDSIIISERPSTWSSLINTNDPTNRDANIVYPAVFIITAIRVGLNDHVAMEAGNYGWSLNTLIESGLISHASESPDEEEVIEEVVEEEEDLPFN